MGPRGPEGHRPCSLVFVCPSPSPPITWLRRAGVLPSVLSRGELGMCLVLSACVIIRCTVTPARRHLSPPLPQGNSYGQERSTYLLSRDPEPPGGSPQPRETGPFRQSSPSLLEGASSPGSPMHCGLDGAWGSPQTWKPLDSPPCRPALGVPRGQAGARPGLRPCLPSFPAPGPGTFLLV